MIEESIKKVKQAKPLINPNVRNLVLNKNLFEQLSHVKRGGINIYKLNGWMVHVLVAYEVVNSDIPFGNLRSSASDYQKLFFLEIAKERALLHPVKPVTLAYLRYLAPYSIIREDEPLFHPQTS